MFLDQDNYMLQKLSRNAGAKIVVHDSALPPLTDENGIDLQQTTATSIALQTVKKKHYGTKKIMIIPCFNTVLFIVRAPLLQQSRVS